ncbi:MAG: ABC transporter permease [Anaerolineae bacterium]|nr:ABC transporter permease [Anaerolineae bacterium]
MTRISPLSARRTLAITRKEFRHITRDLRTFFLVTVSPAFLLLTLSYIFAFDIEQFDLMLWDMDQSALSRQYVAALIADGDLRIQQHVSSYAEIDQQLLQGGLDGGILIPAGFEEQLLSGRPVNVELVMDGADPFSAQQGSAAIEQRTNAFAAQFAASHSLARGGLDLRGVVWYNPTLKSLISMVPGLTAVVLCMPALALALALAREKETGSFEGLIASPIRGSEYLVGKLFAYVSSGLASVFLAWLAAVLYFKIPFRSNLLFYLLLAADYLLASMGFSLIIANFVRSQQTAMFLILMIFFVPSFFVAGLIYPVSHNSMAQLVAYSLPTTHFIAISRGAFLKGVGLAELWPPAAALLVMGLGGLLVSLFMFKKHLA